MHPLRAKNPLVKPFLKWAGGKRQLLPEIRKHIPVFRTYIEPFVGAGAVLFDLQPKDAIISDSNTQLILTYTALRDDVETVSKALGEHKNKYNEEYFYAIREIDRDKQFFDGLSHAELAARFIFLNKTCYNGLYRVNSQGLFNVPFGRYKNPLIHEEATLRAVGEYFSRANVTIVNKDFEEVALQARKGDFVYFDPPYHSPDNTNFTGYQAGGFAEQEQVRLYKCFVKLTRRKIPCLLSNADTAFIKKLYKAFTLLTVPAKRLINTNSQGRGFVNELLIRNW